MLNIGSSTKEFRSNIQPWIDGEIFKPLISQKVKVVHSDIKDADGVDLVGDLCDHEFLSKLSGMKFRSIICANMLEHVTDRKVICDGLEEIVSSAGYIIVTVPYNYPYHPDPIDTRYRPVPEELASLFPSCDLVYHDIIDCGTYRDRLPAGFMGLSMMVVRLCMPFYKPVSWWRQICFIPWVFRQFKVTFAVFKKK
ncbi:MAG TPA: methyltransferase type 11 [Gammaproteobacteria bacterium]|nr:methyltransferase type 11 [Gammaproteobacteria bacterium]